MEQVVVMFPSLAAWLIVALVGVIATGGGWAVKKFMHRLDTQDETLNKIADLLASEISKLREADHDIEKRVVRIETHVGIDLVPPYRRRATDAPQGD